MKYPCSYDLGFVGVHTSLSDKAVWTVSHQLPEDHGTARYRIHNQLREFCEPLR